MTFRRMIWFAGFLGVVSLTGCKSDGPGSAAQSAIVQQVEAAGSGKLDGVDRATIQAWLAGHRQVAQSIGPQCKAVGANAPAAWATTTEGNVCTADAQVLFLTSTQHYKPY